VGNRLELLVFGWPPILFGLILIAAAHVFKRINIGIAGLLCALPFCLQTTVFNLPFIGLFAWLLAAIGIYALSEGEFFWARWLCVPLVVLVGYVAVMVFSFLRIM
jgi:hypothetical protein